MPELYKTYLYPQLVCGCCKMSMYVNENYESVMCANHNCELFNFKMKIPFFELEAY